MTTTESIRILTEYNAWRRGAETEMLDPILIREAIDKAVEVMEAGVGVCPKCGRSDVIWTCWCNKCKVTH